MINLQGLENIIEKFSDAESKIKTFEENLLRVGEERANIDFNSVVYEGDRDVTFSQDFPSIDEFTLRASGKGVIFMEYGSGVGATHPEGSSKGFTPDSWSVNDKREFHEKGYWHYNGKTIYGQPPARAMYNARKEMLKNANEKFEEVFK